MILLAAILLLLIAFYCYSKKSHDYWSQRRVQHYPPIPFFGHIFRHGIKSMTEISSELYKKFPNEKVVGYYRGSTPELVIRDPDIIRNILNVDFSHFHQRGLGRNPRKEPLMMNLFHSDGDLWKLIRGRLTSAFTITKVKNMFPLIVKCAEKLQGLGEEIVARGGECDAQDIMARFTIEFIGTCGLGVEMDTINNEKSLFRELGRKIFSASLKKSILLFFWELCPKLRHYLYIGKPEVEKWLTEIVQNICEQRHRKPIGRNDFIDLLLELENKGKIVGESIERSNPDGSPMTVEIEMNLNIITAQVYVFFAAGFETSSSSTSFTLHQLAYHPQLQTNIQEQIDEVLNKYNNKLCYDAITKLTILKMAFEESMRLFPPLGVLNRTCAKKYTFPELNITIDPGVKIIIPVQAIQTDEKYFESPKEFRPERFAPENVKGRNKFVYMPFGAGPRACIGKVIRFCIIQNTRGERELGLMQSLAGLTAVLHKFTVVPSVATRRHPEIDHRVNVVQRIKGGLPLKLNLRKSNKH